MKVNVFSKVQTGPIYHCPTCGATAKCLIPHSNGGHLAAWRDHIAYLDLPAPCRQANHPTRVAVLGAACTPLAFPYDDDATSATTEECVALIREALDRIVQETGPTGAPHDPAANIVYRLLAGVLAPEPAIAEIRELIQ